MTEKLSITKRLDELQKEGWRFKITSLENTWWTEREGPAIDFWHELKLCGTTDIRIDWTKE